MARRRDIRIIRSIRTPSILMRIVTSVLTPITIPVQIQILSLTPHPRRHSTSHRPARAPPYAQRHTQTSAGIRSVHLISVSREMRSCSGPYRRDMWRVIMRMRGGMRGRMRMRMGIGVRGVFIGRVGWGIVRRRCSRGVDGDWSLEGMGVYVFG
jgi:hypothetical protein